MFTLVISFHFTLIHPKGFINRNLIYPVSEWDCNSRLWHSAWERTREILSLEPVRRGVKDYNLPRFSVDDETKALASGRHIWDFHDL